MRNPIWWEQRNNTRRKRNSNKYNQSTRKDDKECWVYDPKTDLYLKRKAI